mgnify:CR=1 FL=1
MSSLSLGTSKELFVEVVLPRPLEGTLTYRLCIQHDHSEAQNSLMGAWVIVPLGNEKLLACIWSVHTQSELAGHKLKSVCAILHWIKALPSPLLQLLSALSRYYHVPLGEALNLAMPRWISKSAYILNPDRGLKRESTKQSEFIFEQTQQCLEDLKVYDDLKGLSQWMPLARNAFPFYVEPKEWSFWKKSSSIIELKVPQIQVLPSFKWRKQDSFDQQFKERGTVRELYHLFAVQAEYEHKEILSALSHRQEKTIRKTLRSLLDQGHLELLVSPAHQAFQVTQDSNQTLTIKDHLKPSKIENKAQVPIVLSQEQTDAVHAIQAQKGFAVSLLHGVTGSGKTEVYLELIEALLEQGKQALVLVPEIGLTPQTVARFKQRFSVPIYAWHSKLSPNERIETWHHLSQAKPCILIGARSSLFAPLHNLGIIIVDEAHDASYKQGDGIRYHARDMAILRASFEQCPIVLGTATPSLESMQNAYLGKYRLLELKQRPTGATLPNVKIVDLRKHRAVNQEATAITYILAQAISERLKRGEQSILFLNRRGFSQSIRCVGCGYLFSCPHCQLALPWHLKSQSLECHHCEFKAMAPATCPQCSADTLAHTGRGTERIEQQLLSLFPKAKIARLDQDSSLGPQELHNLMHSDQVDILIGTQMVTKGHDFPRVTLVGVIDADVGVDLPDFRANERSYQLLSQVAGRAGRAQLAGEVIVQTYRPQEERLLAAMSHDYQRFFLYEMTLREVLAYPPFSYLANIRIQGPASEHLDQTLQLLSQYVRNCPLRGRGPSIAPINMSRGQQRWLIVLIAEQRAELHAELNKLKPLLKKQSRLGVRCIIDIDPIDFF